MSHQKPASQPEYPSDLPEILYNALKAAVAHSGYVSKFIPDRAESDRYDADDDGRELVTVDTGVSFTAMAAAMADILKAAGYEITRPWKLTDVEGVANLVAVHLPEPDSTNFYEHEDAQPENRLLWSRPPFGVTVWNPGEVQFAYENEPYEPISIDDARSLAAALLAAANAAEATE